MKPSPTKIFLSAILLGIAVFLFILYRLIFPANLGSSGSEVPGTVAFFETSLASTITSSATSFTLVSATDKAGNTLASSTYAFVIDEGTSKEEMVLADCTSTACTNAIRGLSPVSGTTSVSALKYAHGRGASVKITDGPALLILNRLAQGVGQYPNLLTYAGGARCDSSSPGGTICDATFVRNLAGQGAATSTESIGGIVRLATQLQMASSTDNGTDDPAVLYSKYSTSSGGTSAQGLYAVITNNAGKIAQNFWDLTQNFTWTGHHIFSSLFATSASSTNATTTNLYVSGAVTVDSAAIVTGLGQAASTSIWTTSGTWVKPSGAKIVHAQCWGGGGSGGSSPSNRVSSGGGGGGYHEAWIVATSGMSSSISVTIGSGGAAAAAGGNNGNAGGASSFAYVTAYGGSGGLTWTGADIAGGAGGYGGNGSSPFASVAGVAGNHGASGYYSGGSGGGNTNIGSGGNGGSSYYGGGGGASPSSSAEGTPGSSTWGGAGGASDKDGGNGGAGTAPGGGGGGVYGNGGNKAGGAGADGQCIITTYF